MNTSPLRVARTAAGLTQAELAHAADVHEGYLSRVERGRDKSGKHFRRQVVGVLGVSEDLVFGRREPAARPVGS